MLIFHKEIVIFFLRANGHYAKVVSFFQQDTWWHNVSCKISPTASSFCLQAAGGLSSILNREIQPRPRRQFCESFFLREPLKWPGEILRGHKT